MSRFSPRRIGGSAIRPKCFASAWSGTRPWCRTLTVRTRQSHPVIPGLVPGIHVLATTKDVDGRDKARPSRGDVAGVRSGFAVGGVPVFFQVCDERRAEV